MDNLFMPIDGVIVKIVSPESFAIELSEEAKSKNIGEIISDKIKLTIKIKETRIVDVGEFTKYFKKGTKIRFTDGYLLKDIGKDIYYIKLVDIIGIYK